MNRIILIGNGFDLAHGMKTSYSDFITNLWEMIIKKIKSGEKGSLYEDDLIKIRKIPEGIDTVNDYKSLRVLIETVNFFKDDNALYFKNQFLGHLMRLYEDLNWVDIENEYYLQLKKIIKKESSSLSDKALVTELSNCCKTIQSSLKIDMSTPIAEEEDFLDWTEDGINFKTEEEINKAEIKDSLFQLNKDFKAIKDLLVDYLMKEQKRIQAFAKTDIKNAIYAPIVVRNLTEQQQNKIIDDLFERYKLSQDEANPLDLTNSERDLFRRISNVRSNTESEIKNEIRKKITGVFFYGEYLNLRPEEILILNFNYTNPSYLDVYQNPSDLEDENGNPLKYKSIEQIHIHGELNKKKNPIIFGYGDELDDAYQEIEKLNDNVYLENIKSIRYLETKNYKTLLSFINSRPYQVFIFGHSCGNSDRTLLNTLFENENCCSIKPFYREKSKDTDNYSDIIRNISRCFTDKAAFRDKVVNKTYTEALFH